MTRIAFLACETTLPGTGDRRRGDAYEHDLMIAALEPAFARHAFTLEVIDWEAPIEAFDAVDLVLIGTAWNYQDKPEAFLARLEALEARGITVCNSSEIVRWNARKTYLRQLEEGGVAVVPTLWHREVTRAELDEALHHFGGDRLVVKRQVGGGAIDQILISADDLPPADWNYGHRAMIQPFMPSVGDEGELSFVFIDGTLSHALRKRPAKGDYRIQSLYGGSECDLEPTAEEQAAATAVLAALPFEEVPLYARIDMLRGPAGQLMVMEAELIEPYLYPEQGPQLGERLASAIASRL